MLKVLHKETPRQRIYRFNRQVQLLQSIDNSSNFCEQDICTFCTHFIIYPDYESSYGDPDCLVRAPHWEDGDTPILHCRKFKATKDWEIRLLTLLEDNTFKTLRKVEARLMEASND